MVILICEGGIFPAGGLFEVGVFHNGIEGFGVIADVFRKCESTDKKQLASMAVNLKRHTKRKSLCDYIN